MRCAYGALLALQVLAPAAGFSLAGEDRAQTLEATWEKVLDRDGTGLTPIQRVVALLKEMKTQLEADGKKEAEMYDTMVCWCETNEKAKVKAIADAEAKITDLTSEIEARSGKFAELDVNIQKAKEEIAEIEDLLKNKARTQRESEASEFRDEEKTLVQAITNLGNAIQVLSRNHGGASLLALDSSVLASLRRVLREAAISYDFLLGDTTAGAGGRRPLSTHLEAALQAPQVAALVQTEAQGIDGAVLEALTGATRGAAAPVLPLDLAERRLAQEVAQVPRAGAFVQKPYASYAPQSSVIFGILKQMKEDFESKLSQAQKDEIKAAQDYQDLVAAKTAELEALKEKLDLMQDEFYTNQKALGDAKEDLELTRQQRSDDVAFLSDLRLKCQDLDHQWAERTKTRNDELKAVSEAIAIITEDDNRETLARTVTFWQLSNEVGMATRNRAASLLQRAAASPDFDGEDLLSAWRGRAHAGAPALGAAAGPREQLSTLAVSVKIAAFTKVKEAMDKMVAELKAQQAQEVELKSFCTTGFDENAKLTYKKTQTKADLEADIEGLGSLMKKLADEIEAAKEGISATEVEIKKASEAREAENAEYQKVIADQRATQTILTKALKKLQAFYKKALLQKGPTTATPPVQFNAYKKSGGASSVIGMIEQIIEDTKAAEAEAVTAEAEAQSTYELMVTDSNAAVANFNAEILEKTKASEAAKVEQSTAEGSLAATSDELEALAATKADLHQQCDFVLKNFDIRQKARLDEIEAIQKAKAILSGME